MQAFHPSPKRAWLYAVAGFVAWTALVTVLETSLELGIDGVLLVAAGALVAFLYAAAKTAVTSLTTYSIENESLVMERKAFSEERKLIPIKNIDNLHTMASAIGRLLSITDIYVDTPGGFGYEMIIKDAPQAAADELMGLVEKLKQ